MRYGMAGGGGGRHGIMGGWRGRLDGYEVGLNSSRGWMRYRRLERLWRDGRRDERKGGDRIVNQLSTCIFNSSYSLFLVH